MKNVILKHSFNKFCAVTVVSSLFLMSSNSIGQTKDSVQTKTEKEYKNTIHFNLTNPLIFGGRSIIFGYERVLGKHQSFTINAGQTGFPSLNIINSEELKAKTVLSEKGFHVSADYRFYLSKENKYNAPRGVYIGPYYSYNSFEKKHSWALNTADFNGDVNTDLSLTIHTVGIELGYQFIFWNRVSLDMILIGPGIASYNLAASLGTNLSDADKELFFDKLNQALADKFPGYSSTIDDGEFKKKGTTNATSAGFRYMIQLGFRF